MVFKFGDIIGNGWASPQNPTRVGVFVRSGQNTGLVNRGNWIELTDAKGRFWRLMVKGGRLIKLGTLHGPFTLEEQLENFKGCDDQMFKEQGE